MPKSAMHDKSIEVEARGVVYTFHPVPGTFVDVKPNSLVIVYMDKRKRAFVDVWACESEVDYDVQGHLERILVSNRHTWFDKSHAMTRLTACDEDSFSFTGPDKKTVNMARMGDTFYAVKLN